MFSWFRKLFGRESKELETTDEFNEFLRVAHDRMERLKSKGHVHIESDIYAMLRYIVERSASPYKNDVNDEYARALLVKNGIDPQAYFPTQ